MLLHLDVELDRVVPGHGPKGVQTLASIPEFHRKTIKGFPKITAKSKAEAKKRAKIQNIEGSPGSSKTDDDDINRNVGKEAWV